MCSIQGFVMTRSSYMGLLWMDHLMVLPLHFAYWVEYAVFCDCFVTCGAHCSNKSLCHDQFLVLGREHQRLRCDEVSSICQVGPFHCSVSSKWDSNCNVCSWVVWTPIHFIVGGCWHVYRTFRWCCAFTTSSNHFLYYRWCRPESISRVQLQVQTHVLDLWCVGLVCWILGCCAGWFLPRS